MSPTASQGGAALSNGWIGVAKRACPTRTLIELLIRGLARESTPLTVYVQYDPAFAAGVPNVVFDETLDPALSGSRNRSG